MIPNTQSPDTQLGLEPSRFRPHRYAGVRGDKDLYKGDNMVIAATIRGTEDNTEAQEPIMELTSQMELDEHDMTTGDYAIPGRQLEEVMDYQEREAFIDPQLTARYTLPSVEDRVAKSPFDGLTGIGDMAATAQLYRGGPQLLETSLQDGPVIDSSQQPFPGPSDAEIDYTLDTLGEGEPFIYAQAPQTAPLYGLHP